ncbi:hypothetical protein HDA39_002586 [Kribbella italica]|uniref:Uncharacterized protein n=1 Tax=Kribbella italica TaxID=1540520 RepID=A0A7W9J577_9ACTN|nr:hypothetical protein [Kribbella italica]
MCHQPADLSDPLLDLGPRLRLGSPLVGLAPAPLLLTTPMLNLGRLHPVFGLQLLYLGDGGGEDNGSRTVGMAWARRPPSRV